jgi:signal peptidase I
MNEAPSAPRSPWIAALLSLFCTGLGHLYAGRLVTGLALFLASLLFVPLVLLAACLEPTTTVLVGLLSAAAAVVLLYPLSAVGAFLAARRAPAPFQPGEYHRPLLYALFVLVGVSYPLVGVNLLRAHVFEAFQYVERSMNPNLRSGDRVLVNKWSLSGQMPRRGDVVVFRNPGNRRQTWLQRAIALPGDRVEVRAGQVLVNGKRLERDRVPPGSLPPGGTPDGGEVFEESNAGSRYRVLLGAAGERAPDFAEKTVPDGCCFVLGDNRDLAVDSRKFGFVPLGDVLGPVQYIYWPADGWDRFGVRRD